MFGQSLIRILLLPVVVIALAGTLALAEQQSQPSDAGLPSSASSPMSDTASPATGTAPVTESMPDQTNVSPSDPNVAPADATAPATPAEQPEKKRKGKKDAPVLDPVGEGKMLFETRCATCHSAPRPNAHTMSEWPECLNRMAPRSYLRDSDVKLMLLYLEQELKPHSTSEWDSKEG